MCVKQKTEIQYRREVAHSYVINWMYYRREYLTRHAMYTLSNKNPSAWNFLSPEPEVTCGTVAIIIRVFYFPHICAFVVFLCLTFITINHSTYILTKDNNMFA